MSIVNGVVFGGCRSEKREEKTILFYFFLKHQKLLFGKKHNFDKRKCFFVYFDVFQMDLEIISTFFRLQKIIIRRRKVQKSFNFD